MASFGKEIFVSYGREPEVSAFVKKLKLDLEALGFSVWLDTDDIPAGSDWHGAIGKRSAHNYYNHQILLLFYRHWSAAEQSTDCCHHKQVYQL